MGFARPRLWTRERLYWMVHTSEFRHMRRRSSSCSRFALFCTKKATSSERCVVRTGASSMQRFSKTSRIWRTPSVCDESKLCCNTMSICGTALCIAARSAWSSISRFSATLLNARTVVIRTSKLSGSWIPFAKRDMIWGSSCFRASVSTNVSSTINRTSMAVWRCRALGAVADSYSHGRRAGHEWFGSSLRAISAIKRANALRIAAFCSCAIISRSLLLTPSRISTRCFVHTLVLLASFFRSSTAASCRTARSEDVAIISKSAGTALPSFRYRD